jgi:hypothetical protein
MITTRRRKTCYRIWLYKVQTTRKKKEKNRNVQTAPSTWGTLATDLAKWQAGAATVASTLFYSISIFHVQPVASIERIDRTPASAFPYLPPVAYGFAAIKIPNRTLTTACMIFVTMSAD